MILAPHEHLALTATVGSGLVAGLCFTFGSFALRAFGALGAPGAIRAMQAINAAILRSSARVAWFGTAVAGVAAGLLAEERALGLVAAALYAVGALGITGLGDVPLDEELDRVDPDGPGAGGAGRRYRVLWSRWNALRTVACALASAGFARVA